MHCDRTHRILQQAVESLGGSLEDATYKLDKKGDIVATVKLTVPHDSQPTLFPPAANYAIDLEEREAK